MIASNDLNQIEEDSIKDILSSMGIDQYEPNVVVALSEYARRFASELLCDAKDYADHAERLDIVVEDVKLAVKLSDMRVTGVDPRIQIVNKVASQINSKDLIELLNKDDVSIRYPKSLQDSLLERTYTFVPGSVAYPEENIYNLNKNDNNNINDNNNNNNNNNNGKFKPIVISKSAEKRSRDITRDPSFKSDS